MLDERRSQAVTVRFKPSLRAAVEADRQAKGQALVEWLERAAQIALAISSTKHQEN
jgi:hypothetical protein